MLSVNIFEMQSRARASYSALSELLPDVESFQNEVCDSKLLLKCFEDKNMSQLRSLQSQLELLHSQAIKMKSDVAVMRSTVSMMVNNSFTEIDTINSEKTVIRFESTDDDIFDTTHASRAFTGSERQLTFQSSQAQLAGELFVNGANVFLSNKKKETVNKTANSKSKKCHYCGEKISSRVLHMQKYHPGQKSFPCKSCGKEFDEYKEFQNHRKTHVITPFFKCDLCNTKLKSMQSLSKHINSHGGKKPYICHVCGQTFKCKTSLDNCKHRIIARGDSNRTGYHCKTCGKFFSTAGPNNKQLGKICNCEESEQNKVYLVIGKEEHQLSHVNNEKTFCCTICPKKFTKQWLLKQHINLHTGETPFKCEICYRKFHTSKAKGVHKYLKHSVSYQGFRCKICGEKCRSGLGREAHYLTHTPEELACHNIFIKMAECDVCGKMVRKNYLTNHKLSHASKDSFICEVCGKGFKRVGNLKKHIMVHMEPQDKFLLQPRTPHFLQRTEKKHICNVCGRAFSIKFQLILHNRIHTGERPYRCDVCGKSFTTPQGLKFHEVVHTKIKAFKCNLCGEAFTLQSNLNRHCSIHTGQRPFQCDLCGKSFVQKVHLVRHQRIHTGEKPYQCYHCGKKFSDPSTLHKHKVRHEKDLQGIVKIE